MENYPRPGNPLPLLHFPWHDAPFMNSGELMLVPATAPGRFGVEFHDNGTTDSFFGSYDLLGNASNIGENEHPRFSYYYKPDAGNSFTASPYLNWGSEDSAYMQRLFDFVHVPSKFAGTVQGRTDGVNSKPIYSMREPGKLNLNTLTEEGWQTLKNGRADFPSYAEYRQSRQWSEAPGDLNNYPSEFKPFRAPSGTHFVPPLAGTNPERLYDTSTNATLMGLEEEENGTKKPMLIDEDAANPYTALENVMRLSDVTTTRSNVFAVWVTVGYFDAAKIENLEALQNRYPDKMNHITNAAQFSAIYPDGYVWGAEKGLDNGTAKRHRAFYLIDRSTPVGFRRGEELNSKDVIIKKTILD
jgi:hypothetical protein